MSFRISKPFPADRRPQIPQETVLFAEQAAEFRHQGRAHAVFIGIEPGAGLAARSLRAGGFFP